MGIDFNNVPLSIFINLIFASIIVCILFLNWSPILNVSIVFFSSIAALTAVFTNHENNVSSWSSSDVFSPFFFSSGIPFWPKCIISNIKASSAAANSPIAIISLSKTDPDNWNFCSLRISSTIFLSIISNLPIDDAWEEIIDKSLSAIKSVSLFWDGRITSFFFSRVKLVSSWAFTGKTVLIKTKSRKIFLIITFLGYLFSR